MIHLQMFYIELRNTLALVFILSITLKYGVEERAVLNSLLDSSFLYNFKNSFDAL